MALKKKNAGPAVCISDLHFGFDTASVFEGLKLEVPQFSRCLLMGANGAGKSTLIKVISGVGPADEGEIFLEGKQVHIPNPQSANNLGIETVYQDLALCDNLDVVANLFLGREEHSMLRDRKSVV